MIKNYIKIAFRSLIKNQKHTILNISGLAVALAACVIIFLVLQFELSFNKHLTQYDNIFHVQTNEGNSEQEELTGGVPFPTLKFLKKITPNIKWVK